MLGRWLADVIRMNPTTSASSAPTRRHPTGSRPRLRGDRQAVERGILADIGRPPGARRPRDGDAERAPVPGLAGGLPAHRSARPLQLLRGLRAHRRLDVQPARQVARDGEDGSRGAVRSRASTTCSPATSGGRTTTASAIRTPASSTSPSTRAPRSCGSTCRSTRTRCCRPTTTACARSTTSTWWWPASSPPRSG